MNNIYIENSQNVWIKKPKKKGAFLVVNLLVVVVFIAVVLFVVVFVVDLFVIIIIISIIIRQEVSIQNQGAGTNRVKVPAPPTVKKWFLGFVII